ncbi:MAG: uroporphyrinogen-III synthase [Caulobacter sp.]|nr:uroporphyrinogen-III synthase [Caulobacter sp.]
MRSGQPDGVPTPKPTPAPLVWITRAEPGASATAGRVRDKGWAPLVAPLLEARSLPGAALDLSGVAAVAFTSARGARAFAALTPARPPAFTVGEATAGAARAAGFETVWSADGDVAALAALIAAADPGPVLHAGALHPAGDLTGDLVARGVEARAVALYDTVPVDPAPALARLDEVGAVLVHSPRAAGLLARVLLAHPAPAMRLLALSEAVAAPLRAVENAKIAVAPFPNEVSLLNLL